MKHKLLKLTIVYLIIVIVTFTAVLVYLIPYTPHDAMAHATREQEAMIEWRCPNEDGTAYTMAYLIMPIDEDDYRASMSRDLLRNSTVFIPSYAQLVDPNDRYVKQIARYISDKTAGYTDYARALTALRFVQDAVAYVSDDELYGCRDFPATPVETLYHRAGDCEDSAILLTSIYLAMGMDAVILDYPEHNAVGVRWEGEEDYLLCQTASPFAHPIHNLMLDGDMPDIVDPTEVPKICIVLNDTIAHLRYGTKRLLGV